MAHGCKKFTEFFYDLMFKKKSLKRFFFKQNNFSALMKVNNNCIEFSDAKSPLRVKFQVYSVLPLPLSPNNLCTIKSQAHKINKKSRQALRPGKTA